MGDLHWGDNLRILRERIPSNTVDICYLDPPFNSNRNFNVLFRESSRLESEAQIQAFTDTWHWGADAEDTYAELVGADHVPHEVSTLIISMRQFIGENDVMAYLVMMTIRLIELHRILKPTGSIYLHCDPTASHYLKVVMDTIFGPKNFVNEIVWKRSSAHSDTRQGMKRCGKIHDVILFYAKDAKKKRHTWNPLYTPYTEEYLESDYGNQTPDGRYFAKGDLTANKPGGDTSYAWRVKRHMSKGSKWEADLDDEYLTPIPDWEYKAVPPYNGRFWAYKKSYLIQLSRCW